MCFFFGAISLTFAVLEFRVFFSSMVNITLFAKIMDIANAYTGLIGQKEVK